jgi:hypothetical protein
VRKAQSLTPWRRPSASLPDLLVAASPFLPLTAGIRSREAEVPIAGELTVQATRRGKTVIEPRVDEASSPVSP